MKGLERIRKLERPNLSFKKFKNKVIPAGYEDWKEQREIERKMRKSEVFRPDTMLIVVDGTDGRVIWADKEADDRRLLYEEDGNAQECKITSKPLEIGSTDVYFTRDGFKGTMALNKDTLLDADVYSKPEELIEANELKNNDENWKGEIESLVGSKATLKSSNEALRERKLLTPQKMSKGQLLMTLGSGTALGLIIATQVGI